MIGWRYGVTVSSNETRGGILGMPPSDPLTSSAVNTASTPGTRRASEQSMLRSVPWATGALTTTMVSMPGRRISAT